MWATTIERFKLAEHKVDGGIVVTVLADGRGLEIEHRLSVAGEGVLRSETLFRNGSGSKIRLELLTSFSLSGITPYAADDAPERIVVHRFRAAWSAEGRMVTDSIEHLHLERVWAGGIKLSERFGQVGSMPVRGWFPTALLEDIKVGVVWGARLAVPTSWQMEVGRRFDDVVLSGGLADREFGHWMKTVEPGEEFKAPVAWVTCVAGSVDEACEELVSVDVPAVEALPEIEKGLPVVYNDWCTSWGEPREEQLLAIADKIAPLGVRYLVIDAGWYMPVSSDAHWSTALGDWQAHPSRFPKGLSATAAAIRERGLVPGLWMEPEHVAEQSAAFHDTDHLLTRDGHTLTMGVRRGWNLHDPYVTTYIDDRVIRLLREAGFGYLKIDYSETLGLGVDHPDGLGEGLRRHGEGTHTMFDRITKALPDLVIEICSAGGHRLEASLLQRSAMSSFSDAHETVEIPIVAAALHRLVLPQQSQIWAVLHKDDSRRRMGYGLAATFLGRMCLSGDVLDLDEGQLGFVKEAIEMYKKAVPAIRKGRSRIVGQIGPSWRHPTGWQGVIRATADFGLVVVHTFQMPPDEFHVHLPGVGWRVVATLTPMVVCQDGDQLSFVNAGEFNSQVLLVSRLE
ncbi:family 36 glycoside hydrolase [Coniochaeta sp. 2T2.1]|nr:family 36 glycoside hydrolase [Coniochaeta sp. 2T2.1]